MDLIGFVPEYMGLIQTKAKISCGLSYLMFGNVGQPRGVLWVISILFVFLVSVWAVLVLALL